MLDSIKYWILGILLAGCTAGFWYYGHSEYDKGYAAAAQKQTDAIVAYQQIVVAKDAEHAKELAQLSTEHTKQLDDIKAAIPVEQEKTRVIVKTIDRPAVCNLHDDELRDFNAAIHSANGSH